MKEAEDFLSNPKLLEHYSLLQGLGVFEYVESLKRELRDHESLLSGASEIFKRTAVDELLDTAVRCISDRFLPSSLVFLWGTNPGRGGLVVKGYRNLKPTVISLPFTSLSPFEPFFLRYPAPINYELFEYQLGNPAQSAPLSALSPEIVVPVIGPSGLYGLILVGPKVLEDQYSPQELAFLDRLMAFTSIAIQNHLHYENSVRDQKTGLFNHGFFMVRLNEEIARSRRMDRNFSVIVIDVDLFKKFNDGYGHLAGDRVLEKLAQVLHTHLRSEDVLSRFGGEEFTILIPESGRDEAWLLAERLREAVAGSVVEWETPLPPVTISLGAACFKSDESVTANDLIQRADEALYLSKQRGRNRTTIYGAGLLFHSQRRH